MPRDCSSARHAETSRFRHQCPGDGYILRSLPGRMFSALELVCIMYAGFKRIEPGMNIGVDLGEVWGMAERLNEADRLNH